MAKKKTMLAEGARVFGEERFLAYAKKHNFEAVEDSYRIVKTHKRAYKERGPHGVTPTLQQNSEYAEVMKVYAFTPQRGIIEGYLVCYPGKKIRFDANAKF